MRIDWNTTTIKLKQVGRVRCEPGWALGPEWSRRLNDFDLWFVGQGSGLMRMQHQTIELRPGLCFWMRPGGLYDATQHLHDPLTVSYAHFELLGKNGRLRSYDRPLPPEVFLPLDTNLVDTIMRRIASTSLATQTRQPMQTTHRQGTLNSHSNIKRTSMKGSRAHSASDLPVPAHMPAAEALFRGLLMELDAESDAAGLSSRGTELHHRQIVQTLAMRINESPGQDHSVAELSREAGYSADHFARVFKQMIGVGPQAYVIRARIDRAKQLLVESSLSISQIADVLGYEDLFFFSRQFKSKTGKTPRQYRNGQRGELYN